jgi:hypothetical protein
MSASGPAVGVPPLERMSAVMYRQLRLRPASAEPSVICSSSSRRPGRAVRGTSKNSTTCGRIARLAIRRPLVT